MPEYAWMCLNKQDSDYVSRPKYAKILNIPKFWIWTGFSICELYTAFWIYQNMTWQSFEYILDSKYARILNMPVLYRVVNIPQYDLICLNRTGIWLNMSESTIIDRVLNMYHTIHSARPLYNLMSTYWEVGVFRNRSKI